MTSTLRDCATTAGVPIDMALQWQSAGYLVDAASWDFSDDGVVNCGYRPERAVSLLRALHAASAPATLDAPPEPKHDPLPPPPVESWRAVAQYERAVYVGDVHCPYQSTSAVGVMLSFLHWFQPHKVYLMGDIADFYQVSKFDKDPSRLMELQDDLDSAKDFIFKVRRVAPDADIAFTVGNHEDRLRKYLCAHPELSSLRAMNLEPLMGLDDYGVKVIGARDLHQYHGFCVEHGEIVRKSSGYTARGQLERRGVSGISGHTHRLGVHYHTDLGGDYLWAENGCLCDRRPSYCSAPDWQNGFSISHFNPDTQRFALEQILIHDGMAVFAGREFSPLRDI